MEEILVDTGKRRLYRRFCRMKEFWVKHRWVRCIVYVIGTIVLPHFLSIVLNSYQNGKTDTAKSLLEWLGLMGDL